jgi:hypothetical protein
MPAVRAHKVDYEHNTVKFALTVLHEATYMLAMCLSYVQQPYWPYSQAV